MQATTIIQSNNELPLQKKLSQSKWQRTALLFVLGYEGAGALLGGSLLVAAPDGRLMNMPVAIMHGTFPDFMVPGAILFAMGILNTAAFFAVLRKTHSDWVMALTALAGMVIWFWIEIAILLQLHWLHVMWGLPVLIGLATAVPLVPSVYRQNGLLYCGILSSVLYFVINIIVPLQWDGYSVLSQVPSELSAVGAPTRTLWLVLATPYTFLMLAFAWGVLKAAGENRRLRIAGILLLTYGALGFLWPFAPMHLRQTLAAGGSTFSDTMHLALGAVTEIVYLLALGFAAAALGKNFRFYSIATFILLFTFGVLTFQDAPGVARNESTPLVGLWERINIGLFLVWIVVLAITLLQRSPNKENNGQTSSGIKSVYQDQSKTPQPA